MTSTRRRSPTTPSFSFMFLLNSHLTLLLLAPNGVECWGNSGHSKVLLRDITTLTLKSSETTTGRRSSPIPQLNCVGGSAQSRADLRPKVVQCYNRGFDGQDVQWECKADLDNNVRFGGVEVVCEGFDYPDDPYILKGSCGLEYELDFVKGAGDSSWFSSSNFNGNPKQSYDSRFSGLSDLLVYAVAAVIIYAFYKTCISNDFNIRDRQYSSTNDDYPDGMGGGGWFGGNNNYGRNNNYGYDNDASCRRNRRGGTGGGGFWTGLATGGLAGYMFGNRGNNYRNNYGGWGGNAGYGGFGTGGGYGGGYGGGGFTGSSGGASSGTSSSSGFGGTRRR